MTIEIDSYTDTYDEIWGFTQKLAAQGASNWEGRIVTWEDAMLCSQDIEESTFNTIESWEEVDDPSFDRLAAQLIWAGTLPENRHLLDREIQYLVTGKDEIFIQQAGLKKGLRKFWKKHKKEIIIAITVIVVVTVVVVVVISSGGTAGSAAGAAGGDLIKEVCNYDLADKEKNNASAAPQPITTVAPEITVVPESTASNPVGEISFDQYPLETFSLGSSNFTEPLPSYLLPKSIKDIEASQPNPSAFQHGRDIPPYMDPNARHLLETLLPQEKPKPNFFENLFNGVAQEAHELHWSAPLPTGSYSENLFPELLDPQQLSNISRPTLLQKIEEIKQDRDAQFPPFKPQATALIGDPEKGTVHFHCGISNSLQTTQEGGQRLYESFDDELAVQPHWIHKDNIVHGLSMVGLEQLEKTCINHRDTPFVSPIAGTFEKVAHGLLSHSDIQKSIDYETTLLSNMAKDILAQNNPKLKQVHVVFSNGGYVMKKTLESLPQEYKDTIILIPVGPTAIIDDGVGCHKVYHVIGDKDWASKMCNGGEKGLRGAAENANIQITEQIETKAGVGGHYFNQPDYQDKLKLLLNEEIRLNYELY